MAQSKDIGRKMSVFLARKSTFSRALNDPIITKIRSRTRRFADVVIRRNRNELDDNLEFRPSMDVVVGEKFEKHDRAATGGRRRCLPFRAKPERFRFAVTQTVSGQSRAEANL